MAITVKQTSQSQALATISNVLLTTFILMILYYGRELLVPLALSLLLTFMLAPLVTRLQRWLGRIGAVLLVVAMIFTATGILGWALTRQTIDLANKLPDYKENIQTKLHSVQMPNHGPFSKISKLLAELEMELPGKTQTAPGATGKNSAAVKVTPVEIVKGNDQRLEFLQVVLAPVLGPLGTAALVILLLIFMLLQREDLRNRLIKLIGQGRISTTARVMDDAGARVSKYLLMQLVVNLTYGIAVAIGLSIIGVPNAILWGALATVLRFIPYVGPWIAAAFPILLSLASSPGWGAPIYTMMLFIVLELISNNVMEPWLYGSSTGVTPIALIVAALAWTWLWGPVGLVLSAPLTVCMVVMGRHIPKLAFLSIVLSDEDALTPAEDCYQRLLRVGEHDEMELVDQYLKANPPQALFENVLIPVVIAAGSDHRLGILEAGQLDYVERGVNEILTSISPEQPSANDVDLVVCCVPSKAHRDQLAGDMLIQLLWQDGYSARSVAAGIPIGDLINWVRETKGNVVCVSAVAPSTLVHARILCSKLRTNFPNIKIIVGLWGKSETAQENVTILKDSGADDVLATLSEMTEKVSIYMPKPVSGERTQMIDS